MQWKSGESWGQNGLGKNLQLLENQLWMMLNLALIMFNNLNQTLELLIVKSICCLLSLGEHIKPGVNINHCHGGILFHIEFESEPFDRLDETNRILEGVDVIEGGHLLQLGPHQFSVLSPHQREKLLEVCLNLLPPLDKLCDLNVSDLDLGV